MKNEFFEEHNKRTNWPKVNEDNLDKTKREIFLNRKKAVDMYLDGCNSLSEIESQTGISRARLYILLERCISKDSRNNILGYKALIPYYRIKQYNVKKDIHINGNVNRFTKKTGAFSKLLNDYPTIKEGIDKLIFNKDSKDNIIQNNRTKDIYKKFINLCKSANLSPQKGDYPFNTQDMGKRSFYRYVKYMKEKNPNQSIQNYGNDAMTYFRTTGVGEKEKLIERPLERVEFDGHKVDAVMALKFTTPEGDEVVNIIHRMWILMIVDVATRAILSVHTIINQEYSSDDVIETVRKAVLPWKPKELSIPGLKYPNNGGFVSSVIPSMKYAVWDELCFDNAKANLAEKLRPILKRLIGSSVNTGPVGTPTRRPIVEQLFHLLESNGFHRLSNTTGSYLKDPKRKNPEKEAIKYEISFQELEQLTDILVATRNGKPQKGLNYLSPLEVMEQRINRGFPIRFLSEKYRDGSTFMITHDERTVRGNISTGKRPYIHYQGVEYRNYILAEDYTIVGEKLTLEIDIEDLRLIRAFLPNGSELGLLSAKGKWGIVKHSLRQRKEINKLVHRGELYFLSEDDPMEAYENYLRSKAKSSRATRTKLANLQNQQKELENENPKESIDEIEDTSDDIKNSSNENTLISKPKLAENNKKHISKERFFFNS